MMNVHKNKISIIVTVYNKEKYIIETLNSIISQLDNNCELVIVNDGSIDKSSKKIKEFLDKFGSRKNIIFINRETNQGVVFSKKEGLKASTGEFVLFIDGDDILRNNVLKHLYNTKKNKKELIVFNLKEFKKKYSTNKNNLDFKKKLKNKEFIYNEMLESDSQNSMSNKLYHRGYLLTVTKNIRSIDFGEDLEINMKYLKKVDRIGFIDENLIYYRKGILSLTSKFHISNFRRKAINTWEIRNENINNEPKDKKKVDSLLIKNTFYFLAELEKHSHKYSRTEISRCWVKVQNEIKKTKISFLNIKGFKAKIMYIIVFSPKTISRKIISFFWNK